MARAAVGEGHKRDDRSSRTRRCRRPAPRVTGRDADSDRRPARIGTSGDGWDRRRAETELRHVLADVESIGTTRRTIQDLRPLLADHVGADAVIVRVTDDPSGLRHVYATAGHVHARLTFLRGRFIGAKRFDGWNAAPDTRDTRMELQ